MRRQKTKLLITVFLITDYSGLGSTEQSCSQLREDTKKENQDNECSDRDRGEQADGNRGLGSGRCLPIHGSHHLQIIVEPATDRNDGDDDEQKLLRLEGYFKNEEFT